LTANHIENITPFPDQNQQLQGLKHLSLSFNRLRFWPDVDALSLWCPALETLSLMGNPLVEGE
jgi:Leucine-rich repeat (LRR) protein